MIMVLCVLGIPVSTFAVGPTKQKAKQVSNQPLKLQLLGINDFHGQLDTYNSTLNAGGIEYLAAYLKQREAQNPNTLLIHDGDVVGASSPISGLLQDEPTIAFLNELGFDIGTVGNHEFDEGVVEMKRLIYGGSHPKTVGKYGRFEGANFPYISANVVDAVTNEPILPPYYIKKVEGVPIGFIGVVTSDTPTMVTPSAVAGVKFTDEAKAINKYAAILKAKGVKTIIVLAHDSSTSKKDGSKPGGRLVDIAKKVDDEVDVMYGAHNHAYTNTIVDGKLLVQSYSYGTAFSDVNLIIDPKTKNVKSKKAEIVTTYRDRITPDAHIKQMLDVYLTDLGSILNKEIGTIPFVISKKVNASGESALGDLVADSMRAETGTDFAFTNPGGLRADLKAGEIIWKDLFEALPFGNKLVKMTVTGADIKTLLEQQWGTVARIMPISGLKVTYDDSRPVGNRIISMVKNDGTPIEANQSYTITVNSFIADGGDEFTSLTKMKNRQVEMGDTDALENYIKTKGVGEPKIDGRMMKVTATF